MSYTIWTLRGWIISAEERGDNDVEFVIFTESKGRIMARATGVRKLSSKLKGILQKYSWVEIDCVEGKAFYRITGARELSFPNTPLVPIVAKMAHVLMKAVYDEDEDDDLYAWCFHRYHANAFRDEPIMYELIWLIGIMRILGHLDVPDEHMSDDTVLSLEERRTYIAACNAILKTM